ncbi:DDE-type integrase/transposase/recombinase [Corynebacterium propinquum]|uniref:DDE-type integrase/transposase/recombinase n=1 Tax=Corynebacterium propinquum TaxID=43769 RepID=UPI00253F988F|nr:DDE-type integrase/transposase/recombinase [Corynebacterium propinquum]MDK4258825.1 DDE-type integrase/transposase/recombinase [Corynebacterium propinquum]MDK4298736.1 DDE-type integrase/transposase/recombinase [Corynebacterium propinquum]
MADFTYVYTHQGFCYVAFITDVYSRRIVGYTVSRTKQSDFGLDALRQALSVCNRYDVKFSAVGIIDHSDAGFQYTSS